MKCFASVLLLCLFLLSHASVFASRDEFFDPEGAVRVIRSEADFLRLLQDPLHDGNPNSVWFVDFYAPWCGFCRDMKSSWEAFAAEIAALQPWLGRDGSLLPEFQGRLPEHPVRASVASVDCTEVPALQRRYQVYSYPTLILFTGDGRQIKYDQRPRSVLGFRTFLQHFGFYPPEPSEVELQEHRSQEDRVVAQQRIRRMVRKFNDPRSRTLESKTPVLGSPGKLSSIQRTLQEDGRMLFPPLPRNHGRSVDFVLRSPLDRRGPAEVIRLLLEEIGVAYQDIRIPRTALGSLREFLESAEGFGILQLPETVILDSDFFAQHFTTASLRSELLQPSFSVEGKQEQRTRQRVTMSGGGQSARGDVRHVISTSLEDDLSQLEPEDEVFPGGSWTDFGGVSTILLQLGERFGLAPLRTQESPAEVLTEFQSLWDLCLSLRHRIQNAKDSLLLPLPLRPHLLRPVPSSAARDAPVPPGEESETEKLKEMGKMEMEEGRREELRDLLLAGEASSSGLLAGLEVLEETLLRSGASEEFFLTQVSEAERRRRGRTDGGAEDEVEAERAAARPSLLDFLVYDLLDTVAALDPKYLRDRHPDLETWYEWFGGRPSIAAYRKSERRPKML